MEKKKLTDLCVEVQNANFEDSKQVAEILVIADSQNVSEVLESLEKMTNSEKCQETDKELAAKASVVKKVRVGVIGCGKAVMEATIATVSSCAAKGSLAAFAEHLIELSTKEVQQLAQILEDEYGIVPARCLPNEAIIHLEPEVPSQRMVKSKKRKPDYYVPKKLGRINSKTKR